MRSAVQSCVPLQESTAKCCVFFRSYTRQATPRRGWTLAFLSLKACFQSDRNGDGQPGSAATGGLMSLTLKHHRVLFKSFLGYHATGHNGLEGALRATETSCVPLLENQALTKFSWVLFSLQGTLGELENLEFCLVFTVSTGALQVYPPSPYRFQDCQ